MDKTKAICEYLRRHHVGKENAIHSRELEKMFLLDGRSIRRKISALRQEGAAICSDEAGYYFADIRDHRTGRGNTACDCFRAPAEAESAAAGEEQHK